LSCTSYFQRFVFFWRFASRCNLAWRQSDSVFFRRDDFQAVHDGDGMADDAEDIVAP
jgi:hypothetical protein